MKSVLIADDSAFMRISIRSILEKNGFSVIGEAGSGEDVIQKYKVLKPDIVTMDITMPDMDGIEATKRIKGIDSGAVILMLSAMGQEKFVREAIIAGAKTFVVKPFKEEVLLETIKKL